MMLFPLFLFFVLCTKTSFRTWHWQPALPSQNAAVLKILKWNLFPRNVATIYLVSSDNLAFQKYGLIVYVNCKAFYYILHVGLWLLSAKVNTELISLWIMTLIYQLQSASSKGILLRSCGRRTPLAAKYFHFTEPIFLLKGLPAAHSHCVYSCM